MSNEWKERLQALYIDLNRRFIMEVEKGADWDELSLLMDQMKEISAELNTIPTAVKLDIHHRAPEK